MNDKKTVLAVVILLGATGLLCILGAIVLSAFDKGVPDGLWTIGGGALGGLTGLLASTRTQADPNV